MQRPTHTQTIHTGKDRHTNAHKDIDTDTHTLNTATAIAKLQIQAASQPALTGTTVGKIALQWWHSQQDRITVETISGTQDGSTDDGHADYTHGRRGGGLRGRGKEGGDGKKELLRLNIK